MPFYEYQCPSCGESFEKFVRSMDAPKPACPKCGQKKVDRKLSVFGVGAGQASQAPASSCSTCPTGSCPMAGL